ncbi:unnamed protein product [Tuber melanosporum]|uniref:(Perigord truffle) hypothetical protein n=1 Tax=Tuber melanosporum (strain Mel28) TaxID=656061 RepID=D5GC98_TUBMM|nr:uncharacterized protein GSTUM_00000590001 [Tuber melanosporum]CAZ82141.1 unnamed protein product [Tuber melanosporum]
MSGKRPRAAYEADGGEGSNSNSAPFVAFGTALPASDSETRDDGSYVPVWKQEVTDERGRKRLHGAFTGGFSAGYFNTVGSKEGWTPATFKSSRGARAKAAQARPEDFMDEEDLKEAAEAQVVETASGFSGIGSTEEELGRRARQVTLMDLLTPAVQDTMGAKLLKKMGWKEGQGIGPKVRRKAVIDDAVDDTGKTYFFAPTNSAIVTLTRKNDSKGLGFVGEERLQQGKELEIERPAVKEKKRRGGGFGVGVLNDDGDEEEDPYEIRPKSAYNRVIGGEKKKAAIVKKPARHVFVSRRVGKSKATMSLLKCHDGRLPLEGFILSTEPVQTQDGWYPPPTVPKDWKPASLKTPGPQGTKPTAAPSLEQKLDPHLRGKLLGETPLPGKSVFDFLTPAVRDRLASVTGNQNLPPALGEAPPTTYSSSSSSMADLVPKLDKSQALGALKGGFMPYADDLEKRSRYRAFLEVQAGLREGLPDRKYGMNTQGWVKEMNEFMGAARIFKPLTGMIATRFTPSSSSSSNIQGDTDVPTDPDVLIHRPQQKTEDPAQAAARMSMYGPLTRSVIDFYPSRLLCKRFNVPPPNYSNAPARAMERSTGPENKPGPSRELAAQAQITNMMREVKGDDKYELPGVEQKPIVPTVDTGRNEALEGERAGEEVFKAIFGDSDDDSDDE